MAAAYVVLAAGCAQPRGEPPAQLPAATAAASLPATESAKPAEARLGTQWESLFDGASLRGWKVTDFAGHGDVAVAQGEIRVDAGAALSGINWTNAVPRSNYEIQLEAKKIEGSDFFCGLTVPFHTNHFTFVAGGWGGAVVGISSIDGQDASENETTKFMNFPKGGWHRIELQILTNRIVARIDGEIMADVDTTDRRISMRFGEIELSEPLGIATYQTAAAFRNLRWRRLQNAR